LPLEQQNKSGKKKKKKTGSMFSLKEFLFGVKVPTIIQCFFFLAKSRKLARKKKTLANPTNGFLGIYLKKIAIS
jgi:hypothetical protein